MKVRVFDIVTMNENDTKKSGFNHSGKIFIKKNKWFTYYHKCPRAYNESYDLSV